jgi:hypothetical protein
MTALTFHIFTLTHVLSTFPSFLGEGEELPVISGHNVTFNVSVPLANVQNNFMYNPSSDGSIYFKTVGKIFFDSGEKALLGDGVSGDEHAAMTSTDNIGTYVNDKETYNLNETECNSIGTEYVLYLANKIFGDSGAHRYFSNEAEIHKEIDVQKKFTAGNSTTDISDIDVFRNVAKQGWVETHDADDVGITDEPDNLGLKIWNHLLAKDPDRLTPADEDGDDDTTIGVSGSWHTMPFKADDIIQIKQTISIVGGAALGVTIPERIYSINYILV